MKGEFKLVIDYARKYRLALTVTVISMLLLVAVQLLIPWVIKLLVAAITDRAAGAAPSTGPDFIARLTEVVLIVFIARAGLQFLRSYMGHVAGWGVVADVRS